MEVLGNLNVQCKCGKQHPFEAEEADFDMVSSENRDNSVENGYRWYIDFNCSRCGKAIAVDYNVLEFPKGKLSKQNIRTGSVEVIEKFEFKF